MLQRFDHEASFPEKGTVLLFDTHTVHTLAYFSSGVECWVKVTLKTILDQFAEQRPCFYEKNMQVFNVRSVQHSLKENKWIKSEPCEKCLDNCIICYQ